MGNELIRVMASYFEPDDTCYEDYLLMMDGSCLVETDANADVEDCYELHKGWILDAAHSAIGGWLGDGIKVRLTRPVKVFCFEFMAQSAIGEQANVSGLREIVGGYLPEIEELVQPLLKLKRSWPTECFQHASRWALVDTVWSADYVVHRSIDCGDEWDFECELLGRLDLNDPKLVELLKS